MRDGIILWYEVWYNIMIPYMESVVYGISSIIIMESGIIWNQGYIMESEMVESEMNTCVINGWE